MRPVTRSTIVLPTLSLLAATAAAQTLVDSSGGRLSLTTPGGDQSLKVEVGPAGAARVFGFPGIPDGREFSGLTGLNVVTGGGRDKVELDIETALSFDVRVDTQGGDSETKVKWKVLAGGAPSTASVQLASLTSGAQLAAVEVDSEASSATVSIDARSASELAAKVNSSVISDALRVVLSAGAPKAQFEVSSAASALELDLTAGRVARPNELGFAIAQSRPASVRVNWGIATGASADKVEAKVAAAGSTVTQLGLVQTAGGDDTVLFETEGFSTVSGLTLNGGGGSDTLAQVIKGRYQLSQTVGTRMLGGAGDDRLILTTDTGIYGTGLPNDVFEVIDCGPGIDQFNAFGIIRGCESRL